MNISTINVKHSFKSKAVVSYISRARRNLNSSFAVVTQMLLIACLQLEVSL